MEPKEQIQDMVDGEKAKPESKKLDADGSGEEAKKSCVDSSNGMTGEDVQSIQPILQDLTASGPYGIGHRLVTIKKDHFPIVSVFYPMDREDYDIRKDNIEDNIQWFSAGSDGLDVQERIYGADANLAQGMLAFRVQCVNDAPLHQDFKDGHKKLTPMIFSHGYTSTRTMLMGYIYELVSHGCIVYSWDHTDKSNLLNTDQSKNPPEKVPCESYNPEIHKWGFDEFCAEKLDHRMEDIGTVLNFIKQEEVKQISEIDMSKLVAFGHSLGGISSLEMCKVYPEDFKLCVALDPFYFPRYKQIQDGDDYAIKQNLLIINSENFVSNKPDGFLAKWGITQYDAAEVNDKFYENCENSHKDGKDYNITVKGTGHCNMADAAIVQRDITLMSGDFKLPYNYPLFISLVCAFLDEHQFMPVEYPTKVSEIQLPK